MKTAIAILALTIATAQAQTVTVLTPQIPKAGCGTLTYSESAGGVDAAGNLVAYVVSTGSCALSGRGGRSRKYRVCWTVTFNLQGQQQSYVQSGGGSAASGQPIPPCTFTEDASAVYRVEDSAGNLLATYYTVGTGTTTRAVVEVP